jgi:hypothetical protein
VTARTTLAIAFTFLAGSTAAAQPVVRVAIRQKPPFLVGQQVQIDVQVYAPNFFMSAPTFPVTLDVPGAIVTMPDDSGVNLNETIGGVSYAGIQKTYLFVAQAAGRYTLPPAQIAFRYAIEPGKPADASVRLPPTIIDIALPKGAAPPADGGPGMLVTTVTVAQTLDRDAATLAVGDALTRTIVTTAAHTQAMFIPPPAFAAPDGVRVYPKDPVLSDQREDRVGLVAGRRTDRVVYTFDRPGTYVLPPIEVSWLDAGANRQRTSRAPEIAVTVRGGGASQGIAPELEPVSPAAEPTVPYRQVAEWFALAIALFVAGFVLRRPAVGSIPIVVALVRRAWAALRRDRATHLPPLNPV